MSCGGEPVCDVPKPIGRATPRPINNPSNNTNTNPRRRKTFHSRTLRLISFKAQNPATLTFRDLIILLFSLYAIYRAFFTVGNIYRYLFVVDVRRICPGSSLVGCLGRSVWFVGFDLVGYGWASYVAPWAFVAACVVFFGEEILGRIRSPGGK